MPQQIIPLTDDEILAVSDDPEMVAKFTSDERRRMKRLQGTKTTTDAAVSSLPTMGATALSLAAGGRSNPAGMLLAALGGAGGEGYRQTLEAIRGNWDQVPPTLQAQLSQIASEGVKQGGLEGMGRFIVGPLSRLFGHAAYRTALKVPKAVREEFGAQKVTDTLVKEGVPITRMEAGTRKVEGLLNEAGQDTAQAIAAAEQAGAKPVTMRPVVKSLERTKEDVSKRVMRSEPMGRVQDLRNAALNENPGKIPLTRAQEMKQAEQSLALDAYKKEARGIPVNNLETSVHEDLARGLREAIERRVPGVRNKNQRTQQLIGALKAITAAEGRIANNNLIGMGDALALGSGALGAGAMGPHGAAIGIVQEVLTRPEIASRFGIAMDRAGNPLVTPQILRAMDETLSQLTNE